MSAGPCLHSDRPYARRDGYSRTAGLDPTRAAEAPHKNIDVCLDGDHLVLKDVRRRHRVPTDRADAARGVASLVAVGFAWPPDATYKEPRFTDYLIGLDRNELCVFHSLLGWPTDAVADFCNAAGLKYGGHVDLPVGRTLRGSYPPSDQHIRLWESRFQIGWTCALIGLGLFLALALVINVIVLIVRHV